MTAGTEFIIESEHWFGTTTIAKVMDEARAIVKDMPQGPYFLSVEAHMYLIGSITHLILHERGYDPALLARSASGDLPPGWTHGDMDAELERTRRR